MSPQKLEARGEIEIAAEKAALAKIPYRTITRVMQREYLKASLRLNNGNQCKTARAIGIHRNTMSRQMQELGIVNPRLREADL